MALGGHTLARAGSEEESIRIAHEAIDSGITFFDNAWDYHRGKAEELMGRALKGKRDKVFLMTKFGQGRSKDASMKMLEDSLRRLGTDRIDLWQIHSIQNEKDVDVIYGAGGAIEALELAKKQGRIRYAGFTGHREPKAHLKMLAGGFEFDASQMPLSVFDGGYKNKSYQQEVLPELIKRGVAVLGMKSLGGNGRPVRDGVLTSEEAIRYVLSLPVSTLVVGIDSPDYLRKNLKVAQAYEPMLMDEMIALEQRCTEYARTARYEWYKRLDYRDDGSESDRLVRAAAADEKFA